MEHLQCITDEGVNLINNNPAAATPGGPASRGVNLPTPALHCVWARHVRARASALQHAAEVLAGAVAKARRVGGVGDDAEGFEGSLASCVAAAKAVGRETAQLESGLFATWQEEAMATLREVRLVRWACGFSIRNRLLSFVTLRAPSIALGVAGTN